MGGLETILIGLGVLREDGELAISPAVLMAAHLMTSEVLQALQGARARWHKRFQSVKTARPKSFRTGLARTG